jgi:DNA-directed RNA polymerase subunit L
MIMACNVMIDKITNFIEDIQNKQIITTSNDTLNNSYIITLDKEDYTLGKVIEYLLYTMYFGNEISFCGFRKPHPHIDSSLIKVAFVKEVDDDVIITKVVKASLKGIEIYQQIKDNFIETKI